MVRVRFAPSPTGYLHVGGARTALFNWLFARRHGGVFVLRIEDTDVERSSAEMVDGILDGMRWLGLDWDEGPEVGGPHAPVLPVRAARSLPRDGRATRGATGNAYYCYCTPEELQASASAAEAAGGAWRYDRACCARWTTKHARADERESRPRAIRFRVRPASRASTISCTARSSSTARNIEDFVILRSDGHPTYHLSVVADDVEMEITHVVRGDDHISNTPKQVLLYQALGAPVPQFAHVPLILGPDKKRLSKRHGATSVMEYARQGYLPEAMVNFLALLGWSPGSGDRELFTARRAGGGVRPRRHQRRQRGLQPREAGLVQPAAHAAAVAGRTGSPCAAVVRSGRSVGRRPPRRSSRLVLRRARIVESRARSVSTSSPSLGRFFFSDDIECDRGGGGEARGAEAQREHLAAAGAAIAGARGVRCRVARSRRAQRRGGARA